MAVAVHFSRRGLECLEGFELRGRRDGPEEATELRKAMAEVTGITASAIALNVLPRVPGAPQCAVKPVSGQSLLGFLEQSCREDHGVYQLRASFEHVSHDSFVQVRVACPGTATSKAAANSSETQVPILIEQFELGAERTVANLKKLIHCRTKFPLDQMVLLLGCRRLHEELPMGRVAGAAEASNAPLQLHLAAQGALAFLRREGQGHKELQDAPHTMKLLLPRCVRGSRERPMPFNLQQGLDELRWSVQSISGLSPARMRLLLDGEDLTEESGTLDEIGFTDGCTLQVEEGPADAVSDFDMPVDIPSSGPASLVYELAAQHLHCDAQRLALFAGNEYVERGDLATAPIADGVVISAYCSWPLQLPIYFIQSGMSQFPEVSELELPGHLTCRSCDSVAELRARLLAACRCEVLENCLVFAVERGHWQREGNGCQTLASLEALMGDFSPCPDTARLSRLGLADGASCLIFVTRRMISVEIEVYQGDECKGQRQLRVPSTMRLSEMSTMLIRSLRQSPLADLAPSDLAQCSWRPHEDRPRSSSSLSVSEGVVAVISKVKRKSFSSESPQKRRRLANELSETSFLADLLAEHAEPQGRCQQFLCPITMEIMQDPVVVGGSGNTYDRKSIEKHFQHCHRDPLNNMELRRPVDRKLIPNNQLRSQIREAEIARVQLKLCAHLTEQRSFSSDAPMAAYLGWCASLLRGDRA